ncbi:MAG: hypothetical protein EZS28_052636, partial [Streblomastix strix]
QLLPFVAKLPSLLFLLGEGIRRGYEAAEMMGVTETKDQSGYLCQIINCPSGIVDGLTGNLNLGMMVDQVKRALENEANLESNAEQSELIRLENYHYLLHTFDKLDTLALYSSASSDIQYKSQNAFGSVSASGRSSPSQMDTSYSSSQSSTNLPGYQIIPLSNICTNPIMCSRETVV